MSSEKSSAVAVPEEGPALGALLRLAWQRTREGLYEAVRTGGYDDLNRAHVALFRYETLDGERPTQLADRMQITKQSINDLLRHLEACGYVELRPDSDDKRARRVRLTARGRRLDTYIRTQARAVERSIAGEIGPSRYHEFRKTLETIAGTPKPTPET